MLKPREIDVQAHVRRCKICQRIAERLCLECDHPQHEGVCTPGLCDCDISFCLSEDDVEEAQMRCAWEADQAAYEAYCDWKYDEMRGN